jgi:hypothetical protein
MSEALTRPIDLPSAKVRRSAVLHAFESPLGTGQDSIPVRVGVTS